MKIKIQEFLDKCGLEEKLYPGKRIVKKLLQQGENKSHCVVADWRAPDLLRLEIKAGQSGKDMSPKELKKFPLSFQSPTYLEIAVGSGTGVETEEDEDGEAGEARGGKSGGGGKMPRKKSLNAFSAVVAGKIPEGGEIKKLVLMGKEIARGAFAAVLDSLAAQIKNMSVAPVNLLASVTQVTRFAPGGRNADDIDPTLLKGAKPYKPQPDMFGPPVV